MLQELLYLGPVKRLRRLFSSICVQKLKRVAQATFQNANRAMIEENAQSDKGTESQNYFRTQLEQFERF
jgi:hypothetical protein